MVLWRVHRKDRVIANQFLGRREGESFGPSESPSKGQSNCQLLRDNEAKTSQGNGLGSTPRKNLTKQPSLSLLALLLLLSISSRAVKPNTLSGVSPSLSLSLNRPATASKTWTNQVLLFSMIIFYVVLRHKWELFSFCITKIF